MKMIRLNIIIILASLLYITASVLFCNLFFNKNSNGSLIRINKEIIGSQHIGQEFINDKYFHGRVSLNHYNNYYSGNSNLAYTSRELKEITTNNYLKFKELNKNTNSIDLNLISESASGLDPHITLNAAIIQIPRVSNFGKIEERKLLDLVEKSARPLAFGLFGEKLINVLEVNLKLRELYGTKN